MYLSYQCQFFQHQNVLCTQSSIFHIDNSNLELQNKLIKPKIKKNVCKKKKKFNSFLINRNVMHVNVMSPYYHAEIKFEFYKIGFPHPFLFDNKKNKS